MKDKYIKITHKPKLKNHINKYGILRGIFLYFKHLNEYDIYSKATEDFCSKYQKIGERPKGPFNICKTKNGVRYQVRYKSHVKFSKN